jgi:hypothetical protein
MTTGCSELDEALLKAAKSGRSQYVGYTLDCEWGPLLGPPATDRTHWRADPDGSLWLHEAPILRDYGFEYRLTGYRYEKILGPETPRERTPDQCLDGAP